MTSMAAARAAAGPQGPAGRTLAGAWHWAASAARLLALWTVPALFTLVQLALSARSQGEPVRWGWLLRWQLPVWWLWAAMTPLIVRLARRFPFDAERLARSAALHLGLGLAVASAHALLAGAVTLALAPESLPPAEGLPMRVFRLWAMRLVFDVPFYLAAAAAAGLIDGALRARERAAHERALEAQLVRARLEALRAQLRPHFLFNTLHAISALVGESPAEATALIAKLGDLLRLSLARTGAQEVTLGQEVELLRLYLAIEQVRFGDRLRVEWRVPPELARARVPDFLLQPLVENALKHGLGPRAAPGTLAVSAARDGASLRLEVADDGRGLPAGEATFGVGLATTHERLARLYGPRGALSLSPRAGGGATARVTLPYREGPPPP
jgi:signal transduction histidine kinase